MPGKIIIINGASSAGKSTLAAAVHDRLDQPFLRLSIDHLREGNILPLRRIRSGEFAWTLLELERRERARGDRPIGDARRDFATVHDHALYDLELQSTNPVERNAETLLSAWRSRSRPNAFERMALRAPASDEDSPR